MMCELVAYLVKSVLSDCMKFDNVAMVEIISIEGDLVLIDRNAKVSNNGNVYGYNINNDLVRLADNVKLGFNRRFGVSVDSDNHTDALFNLDEIDRIYLTINHETKALIPYLTPKGVVWEYTE